MSLTQRIRVEDRGQDGFGAVLLSKSKKRRQVEVAEGRGRTPQEALGELVLRHSNCFDSEVSFTYAASMKCAREALELTRKGGKS